MNKVIAASFIDLCQPNSCVNGGECYQETTTDFKCLCLSGFNGKYCEKKVAESRNLVLFIKTKVVLFSSLSFYSL